MEALVVPMVKNVSANAGDIKKCRFDLVGGEIPWRGTQPPVFLPANPMDGVAWWAAESNGVAKKSNTTERARVPRCIL